MFKQYTLALVSFIATLILTLVGGFVLKLSNEGTYLTFAIGTMVTLAAMLLKKDLEESLQNEVIRRLKIYECLEEINDPKLREDIYELVEQTSKGKIPSTIVPTRSRYLLENVKKSILASNYAPDAENIYAWEDHTRRKTFFEGYVRAIKRGVKVEHTLVVKKEQIISNGKWDQKALSIFKKQSAAGVDVRILLSEDLIGRLLAGNLEQDFVIFDNEEVFVIDRKYGNQLYRLPSEKVKEYKDIFAQQLKFTRTLADFLSEHPDVDSTQDAG